MAKFNTILVNPEARTVTEVEYDSGSNGNAGLACIYNLLEVDCVDVARINNKGDGFFVDDEGLMKGEQSFFVFQGYPEPLAGRGLLLGVNDEGESIATDYTLEQIKQRVRFVTPIRMNGKIIFL